MTTQPDLDRALGAWLRDVPPHSDRARVAVLAQLGTTRQRGPRPWWLYGTRAAGRRVLVPARPQHTPGRSRSMLSATRLTALVAMVALGTGAVYLAAGQGPSPEPTAPLATPVPTALLATPSPTAARSTKPLTGLLSRLVTEEVEPGVLRVVSDGHRDLTVMLTPVPERGRTPEDARRAATNLVAGLDGSIWVFGPDESYRVGQPQSYPVTDDTPGFSWQKAEVDPGGRLWTLVESDTETSALRSFGGGSWQTERDDVVAFDLEQDGTVWVNAEERFIRLRDGWRTPQFARGVSDFWMSPVMHGTEAPGDEIEVLVLDEGLTVWLLQEDGDTHGGPAGALTAEIDAVDMGEDGDHWIYQHLDVPLAGRGATDTVAPSRTLDYLVHVTGPTFTVYTDENGVPVLSGPGPGIRAARDGSVWLTPMADEARSSGCDGLANFDGEVWVRYLSGLCVYGFDIATDGTVWVQAAVPHGQDELVEPEPFPVDTFVIRPRGVTP